MRDVLLERLGEDEAVAEPLQASIQELLDRDDFLLRNNVNERTISHRLAMYMQEHFPNWDVDCEYNRNHDDPKRIPAPKRIESDDVDAKTVFPDIIVHHRNTDENLLVLEIKKSSNPESSAEDLDKLSRIKKAFGYKHALFIRFRVGYMRTGVAEILAA